MTANNENGGHQDVAVVVEEEWPASGRVQESNLLQELTADAEVFAKKQKWKDG